MPALLLALALAAPFDAGEPLALEGFSGHLDVPSAFTHAPGAAHLLFTNQRDPRFRGASETRTFVLSAGLLRWLEGSGRVTEANPGPRDLSLGAKLRLPLDLLWPDLPVALAVGTQDEGGAAPHFRTRYAVASARLGWLTASAGWGAGPDRMEGAFAGGTLSPTRYTDLLADWDARELNLGARLRLPFSLFGVPLEASAIAKTTAQEPSRWEVAGGLALPLALGRWREAPPADLRPSATPEGEAHAQGERVSPQPEPYARLTGADAFAEIEAALDDLGLSSVRAAQEGTACAVEYENERYGHAESDALGLVLGALAALAPDACASFSVLLDRQRLPLAAIEGPMAALRAYYGYAGEVRGPGLADALSLRWRPGVPPALAARPRRSGSALHGALSLAPGLTSFVATEPSLLDLQLSLQPSATLQLWPGAQLAARADLPVFRSESLRRGGAYREYGHGPRLEYALAQQALPLAPGLTALASAGLFRAFSAGLGAELVFTPGDGAHALGLEALAARAVGSPAPVDPVARRPALLASWRWSAPWSLQSTVRAGRFLAGDEGFSVDLGRLFGDTHAGVFYAHSDVRILGVSLGLPLGPRRDARPGIAQLRGTRRFTHEVYTRVGEAQNLVTPGVAITPRPPWNLEASWLDLGRVGRDSLAAGLARGREAFRRWGVPAVARLAARRV